MAVHYESALKAAGLSVPVIPAGHPNATDQDNPVMFCFPDVWKLRGDRMSHLLKQDGGGGWQGTER